MTTPELHRFEARLELFPRLRDYAERCCAEAGIGAAARHRLILVLEELFANTVQHGYSGAAGAESAVWLRLAASAGQIDVVYEDAAPEYDPFAKAAPPDYAGPVDTWQPGGVGVVLVIKIGRNVRYERAGGRNRIRFMLPTTAPGV